MANAAKEHGYIECEKPGDGVGIIRLDLGRADRADQLVVAHVEAPGGSKNCGLKNPNSDGTPIISYPFRSILRRISLDYLKYL